MGWGRALALIGAGLEGLGCVALLVLFAWHEGVDEGLQLSAPEAILLALSCLAVLAAILAAIAIGSRPLLGVLFAVSACALCAAGPLQWAAQVGESPGMIGGVWLIQCIFLGSASLVAFARWRLARKST